VSAPSRTVSIDEALVKGWRLVNYPVLALLCGPGLLVILLGDQIDAVLGARRAQTLYWAIFLIGFLGAWLWWSIAVPKWRLWAYERVDDIAELKRRAVAQQLIWPDGSILAKTEIKSRTHAAREAELERQKSFVPSPNKSLERTREE